VQKAFSRELAQIKAGVSEITLVSLLKQRADPIVLYGAGRIGRAVCDVCIANDISITRICDRNVSGSYRGIEIIDPQTLRLYFADACVVVCSYDYNREICDDLYKLGFGAEQILPYPFDCSYFESVDGFKRHFEGYSRAYDFFDDERSKNLVLDRLRMYLLDVPLTVNTQSDCYYEDGIISLGNEETFVDAGAYTGDSAEAFIDKFTRAARGGKYRVYSFEPDTGNYEQAVHNLSKYPNVEVTPKGLWSSETELVFKPNAANMAGSSFIFGTGTNEIRVPVTSLDAFFADKPDIPTFIKMDIEGAEKEALLGASDIIKSAKPKLAICAYHKPEDIYELPQTILGIRDDYDFVLRQHENGCWDTILYAV
jgi:FkbM family methyltransferase